MKSAAHHNATCKHVTMTPLLYLTARKVQFLQRCALLQGLAKVCHACISDPVVPELQYSQVSWVWCCSMELLIQRCLVMDAVEWVCNAVCEIRCTLIRDLAGAEVQVRQLSCNWKGLCQAIDACMQESFV